MDKIICVGKNYLDHAKEMGDSKAPSEPVLFLKPPSVLVAATDRISLPFLHGRGALHHECEIVCRIRSDRGALRFDAITLGLDMTLRDKQSELKTSGHPWEVSKVFENSAIIGPWIELWPAWLETEFRLTVDGDLRQSVKGSRMIFSPETCLAHAVRCFPVLDGDLLFTGTPAGIGPVVSGSVARLTWGDRLSYEVRWI